MSQQLQVRVAWFWSQVDCSGSCWIWRGALDRKGYGRIRFDHRGTGAHRWIYEYWFGAVGTLEVCHYCDTPACVRPSHLYAATHAVNMAQQMSRGRNSPPPRNDGDQHWTRRFPERVGRGERGNAAKLTDSQVDQLRARRREGATYGELIREFPISKSQVARLARGLSRC